MNDISTLSPEFLSFEEGILHERNISRIREKTLEELLVCVRNITDYLSRFDDLKKKIYTSKIQNKMIEESLKYVGDICLNTSLNIGSSSKKEEEVFLPNPFANLEKLNSRYGEASAEAVGCTSFDEDEYIKEKMKEHTPFFVKDHSHPVCEYSKNIPPLTKCELVGHSKEDDESDSYEGIPGGFLMNQRRMGLRHS